MIFCRTAVTPASGHVEKTSELVDKMISHKTKYSKSRVYEWLLRNFFRLRIDACRMSTWGIGMYIAFQSIFTTSLYATYALLHLLAIA